jgi:hypothetical protein
MDDGLVPGKIGLGEVTQVTIDESRKTGSGLAVAIEPAVAIEAGVGADNVVAMLH